MRGLNVCLYLEISKIVSEVSSISPLIWSSVEGRRTEKIEHHVLTEKEPLELLYALFPGKEQKFNGLVLPFFQM